MQPHKDVFFPSARAVPAAVLEGLRAIDDKVVVVWLRRGAWLLGSYIPNRVRMAGAARVLHSLHTSSLPSIYVSKERFRKACIAWGDRVAISHLRAQGVVEHQTFEASAYSEHVVWGHMELWLRAAKWTQQHHYEEYWRAMDAAQGQNDESERRIADMVDHAKLREAYRMGFKAPVTSGWTSASESSSLPIPA